MPSFARPLRQSPRSEVLEWHFPAPHSHLVLTGRSRAAWHTSFVVPQLGLLLDAGLCVNRLRPPHVFVTHGHSDHTMLAPAFVRRVDLSTGGDGHDSDPSNSSDSPGQREHPPDFYCPAEMATALDDFVLSSTMLNLGGLITSADAESQGFSIHGVCPEEDRGWVRGERTPSERAFLRTHATHGMKPGDVVTLRRRRNDPISLTATAFACDHSVPCLGYVFAQTTRRLRPEYADLAGPDLGALRRSGVELTRPHSTPLFAFLGDSTAATLAAAPEWLCEGIPVVITECSFLLPEHKSQADRTRHTVWCDLEPVVRRWPRTTFVLMHFSLRYSDADVAAFFRDLPDPPGNIVVWADPEG